MRKPEKTIDGIAAKFLAFFCAFGLLMTFLYLCYFLEFRKSAKCHFFYSDDEYGDLVHEEALVINWSLLMFFVYSVGLLGIFAESKLLITVFGLLKLCIVLFCLQTRRFETTSLLLLVFGNGTIAFLAFYVCGHFTGMPFIPENKYLLLERKTGSPGEDCFTISDKLKSEKSIDGTTINKV